MQPFRIAGCRPARVTSIGLVPSDDGPSGMTAASCSAVLASGSGASRPLSPKLSTMRAPCPRRSTLGSRPGAPSMSAGSQVQRGCRRGRRRSAL